MISNLKKGNLTLKRPKFICSSNFIGFEFMNISKSFFKKIENLCQHKHSNVFPGAKICRFCLFEICHNKL